MILLDTNFLLGYFFSDDALHEKCLRISQNIKQEEAFIVTEIFHEVITLLSVRTSSKLAIETGKEIQKIFPFFSPDKTAHEHAWKIFQENDPHRFSYEDIFLMALSEIYGFQVLTFDKKLQKRCSIPSFL